MMFCTPAPEALAEAMEFGDERPAKKSTFS
jgi:hypothetical protein